MPTVIGITESIINEPVTETTFDIDGHTTIRIDRTRHEGVWFSIPKTKPIVVGTSTTP